MPHATGDSPVTNGTKPSSQFISHLASYPVVNDGIETFKSNPYGKRSIELADGAYSKFGKPVEPYLETPYSYAKPYLNKADELGDKGLDKVDGHFPIVKEETSTIVDTAKGYVLWPFKLADDGKTYVFKTWNGKPRRNPNRHLPSPFPPPKIPSPKV
ncbi:hypothetical protein K431DRAFT_284032 [Polychaeton citri CBS 116435]|uniref:Uncharacterized protein n=1 Tax=Polychaeton citri CBS 116435 TaxID=1314669 RepID=A0A9P4UNG5_9PEZI|nr:hypothetical protein K431DRAFT_284032 [Polychaeton citri CBS 116435]